MSLLLLFTPSYFDNLHDFAPRVSDLYKRKYKRQEAETDREENPTPTEEGLRDPSAIKARAPSYSGERARYVSFLKQEIEGINERIKLLEAARESLEARRRRRKLIQLDNARRALDEQIRQEYLKQEEEDFMTMIFLFADF